MKTYFLRITEKSLVQIVIHWKVQILIMAQERISLQPGRVYI